MTSKELYITYCKHNAVSSIFMQPFWLQAINANWNVLAVSYKKDIYFLPIITEKKTVFNLLRNPLFVPYTQIQSSSNISVNVVDYFAQQLNQYSLVELHLQLESTQQKVFTNYKFELIKRHTNIINLQQPLVNIYNNFKDSCKRQIKKAEKNISISTTTNLEVIYNLVSGTFAKQKQKMPYTKILLQQLLDTCISNNCGTVLCATNAQNQTIAILWLVWDSEKMYYLLSAQSAEASNSGAVNLLTYQAIQLAQKHQCTIFDFEGSRYKGIDTFFKSFGTTEQKYFCVKKNNSAILKTLLHWKQKF